MNEAQVRKLADGRVYSGAQAKELGLVDQFGTLEDAIELAAKRAGLEGEPAVYYSRPEQERWWERIVYGRFRPPIARNAIAAGCAMNGHRRSFSSARRHL